MQNTLVDRWLACQVAGSGSKDERFAILKEVDDLIYRDADAGWMFTLELIAAAQDDWHLANVAAGPLEDLLKRDPHRLIERVETQARRDPKFRRCLTGVWGLPESISQRLKKYTATVKDPL